MTALRKSLLLAGALAVVSIVGILFFVASGDDSAVPSASGEVASEERVFLSAGEIFIWQLDEDGSRGERISRKKGIVVGGEGTSFFTIFAQDEFLPVGDEDEHGFSSIKDGIEIGFGLEVLSSDSLNRCVALEFGDITCSFSLNDRFPYPEGYDTDSIHTNAAYVTTVTYEDLREHRGDLFALVGSVIGGAKFEGRLVEFAFWSVGLPVDTDAQRFYVDFGGASSMERFIGSPVWMKDGDGYVLVGVITGKTEYSVSVVESFSRVYGDLLSVPRTTD